MQNREWKHTGDAAATTGSCSCTAPPAGTRLWAFAPAQPGKPQFSGCDSAIVRSRTSSRTSTSSQAENCPFSSLCPLTDAGPTNAPSLGRYAVSTAVHREGDVPSTLAPPEAQSCPPPDQITLIHHPGHPHGQPHQNLRIYSADQNLYIIHEYISLLYSDIIN